MRHDKAHHGIAGQDRYEQDVSAVTCADVDMFESSDWSNMVALAEHNLIRPHCWK